MVEPGLSSLLAALAMLAIPQTTSRAGGAQDIVQVDVVNAQADRHERLTVPVRIGEKGTFDFLIDTGSQNTVLSKDLAARLALKPDGQSLVIGVAGTKMADLVTVDEINLGRQSYYSLIAPLLEAHDIGADGILGVDSLQGQRVVLDFARNRIAVGEARELGGNSGYEIVVRARRRSGQLIMTDAVIDGVKTAVVIDTGSANTIGNRALQQALRKRKASVQSTLIGVTGDEIAVELGVANTLKIGDATISHPLIAYADSPSFAALDLEDRPAIMLGMREMRLFGRIAIDFSTRRVYFDLPRGA